MLVNRVQSLPWLNYNRLQKRCPVDCNVCFRGGGGDGYFDADEFRKFAIDILIQCHRNR